APTPVVLAVHGGAWMSGDKWTMRNHSYQLAKRGIAAVSINYRLAPKNKYPKQLDDVRDALVWIVEHAKEYRFDPDRIGLYGYSAGGHLVSSIATLQDEPWESVNVTTEWRRDDPRWSKLPNIVGALAGAPPTDFEGYPEENTAMVYFLGGTRKERPEVYRAASPYTQISKSDPPIHIVHGDADLLVPIKMSRRFIARSKERESETALTVVPRQGHFLTFINPKLAETLLDFFDEHLFGGD
ncbi:MAG: alpha/beta hydrolase, partial [Planctomycetota bacterium]